MFECFCLENEQRFCENCSFKGPDYVEILKPPGSIFIKFVPSPSKLVNFYEEGDQIFQGVLFSTWIECQNLDSNHSGIKISNISAEPGAWIYNQESGLSFEKGDFI